MSYEGSATLETKEDLGKDSKAVVRRWILELKLAEKREKDWRSQAEKVWKRYRQKEAKKNSFNILWSNTETLRPAVYNSLPSADVRRRFKDADPVGKAVAEVLKRSLDYSLDTTDFDGSIKNCVLDMLLPGRGVARVRYVPSLAQVGETAPVEEAEWHQECCEALEGQSEELQWEQAPIEHVQWDDYRQSAGKTWAEVTWVGFRHRLNREELVEQFGEEIGKAVNLDNTDDEDVQKEQDCSVADAFKTAEVWEIWDKDKRNVLFIAPSYKESPLKELGDPLELVGFFPTPRPLYAVEDSGNTVPVCLYDLYKEQAEELDSISARINTLVKGLKLRGVYDSTLTELSELMRGEDNDLIPAANVTALLERGGLDNAIWFMPIEMAAKVLQVLYEQRETTKQVIYEITGIADIIRGSSVASETATAQQIKDKWGSMRLKRMQAEVQRFIRDLIRLQAEIIGERFQPETLAQMTGLKLPTAQEKQQAMMMVQGRQPPEMPPSWEDVIQVMRNDAQRTFKVDIETDSTVAASVESDMAGLREVLQGVVEVINGFAPAVQAGAVPVEAVKEIIMTVCRRARLGNAVEDALDKIQAPKPQQPEQDNSAQLEEVRNQAKMAIEQAKQQASVQIEGMRQQHEQQLELLRQDREDARHQQESMLQLILAKIEEQKAVEVAQISAQTTLDAAQMAAANIASENNDAGL